MVRHLLRWLTSRQSLRRRKNLQRNRHPLRYLYTSVFFAQGLRLSALTDPLRDILAPHSSPCAKICCAIISLPTKWIRLRDWSSDYLHRNFQVDRWLVVDAAGTHHVLPVTNGAAAPPRVVGELLVRRSVP
jgi:hypothetical protein